MANDHDTGYKLLFAAPEMVRDLLRGLVALAWLKSAGLASLVRANDCEISVDLRMRRDSTRWIV